MHMYMHNARTLPALGMVVARTLLWSLSMASRLIAATSPLKGRELRSSPKFATTCMPKHSTSQTYIFQSILARQHQSCDASAVDA
jgi:hypothetical protein